MNDIKDGTIVIARMPMSESILKRIEPSHHVRPHIIYMSNSDSYYCFAMTSNLNLDNQSKICFFKKENSIFRQNGAIYVDKIWRLDEDEILSVIGPIDEQEYNRISKVIYGQRKKLKWLDDALALYEAKYCSEPRHWPGDIVFNKDDQNFYLIYDINGKIYQVCRLENNEEDYQEFSAHEDCLDTYYQELIMLDDNYYFLNCKKRYFFENHGNFEYRTSLDKDLFIRSKMYIKMKKKCRTLENKK